MPTSSKRTTVLSIVFIIILGFTIYANSLNGAFVWDDDLFVKNNIYVKDWRYLPKLFTQDPGEGAGVKYNFYRPFVMFTYMVDYSLWELDVKGYHLTNVVIHILAAILLYYFVRTLWKDSLLAQLTSIFYLVHPIHTEAVANISSRQDPLVLLFMLACFISYIQYLRTHKAGMYVPMILSFGLALLSKENSLMLPALFLCYHYAFKEKIKFWPFLTIVGLSIIYLLLRVTFLKSSMAEASLFTDAINRIPGFFVAIASYVRLLLAPFDLHAEYGYDLFQMSDPRVLLGIMIFCSSLLYALIVRKRNSLIFFALFWFFMSLLPTSGIYPIAFYMAEHYLYVPSVGFFMMLAWILCILYRAKGFKALASVIIPGILVFYSYLTIQQNSYWNEPIAFYNRTLQYAPNNSKLHDKLGVVLYDLGRIDEAITAYKRALEVDPENDSTYNNLGNAYFKSGKINDAILAYKKALEFNPQLVRAQYNMANAYIHVGKTDFALDLLKQAIKKDPDYANAYNNLGALYGSLGKTEEAILSLKEAIRIYPKHAEAYNNLAIIYFNQEEYLLAIENSDMAFKLGLENAGLLAELEAHRK